MKQVTSKPMALFIGLTMFLITSTKLNAAQTEVIDVTLTIQTVSLVRMSTPTIFVALMGMDKVIQDPMTYHNNGDGSETFSVKVGADTGGWNLVSTKPAKDEFRLSGIWHHYALTPTVSEFQTDDILTKSDQNSSDKIFFNEGETHLTVNNEKTGNTPSTIKVENQRAVNVPANDERNLFIRFESPSSITTTPNPTKGKMQLSVTAIAGDN